MQVLFKRPGIKGSGKGVTVREQPHERGYFVSGGLAAKCDKIHASRFKEQQIPHGQGLPLSKSILNNIREQGGSGRGNDW
ncbi:MAG: hypothetical protein ACLU7D_08955 [Collinsella sp.]